MGEHADLAHTDVRKPLAHRPLVISRRVRWRRRGDGRGVVRIGAGLSTDGVSTLSQGLAPEQSDGVSLWPEPLDWAGLSARERDAYEVGFLMGFLMREDEVEQANADADRYYRAAFDRPAARRR